MLMEIEFGSLASNTLLGLFSNLLTKAMPNVLVGYQFAGFPYTRVAEAVKSVENTAAAGHRYDGTWLT